MTHYIFPPAPVYLFPGRHNEDILNIFFTLRVAVPSSQPTVAVGSISRHRISSLFEHALTTYCSSKQPDHAEWTPSERDVRDG